MLGRQPAPSNDSRGIEPGHWKSAGWVNLTSALTLDDPQKNSQRAVQCHPVALHEVTQPLGHRQHPLAHRQVGKNMVHQVRPRLVHAPRVARRAHPRPLQTKATK